MERIVRMNWRGTEGHRKVGGTANSRVDDVGGIGYAECEGRGMEMVSMCRPVWSLRSRLCGASGVSFLGVDQAYLS